MMKWLFAAFIAMFVATPALAWGDQGHSLTCQIAYELMTPKARMAVDALLQKQPQRYRDFPNACTYPDDVKETDGRRLQHFVNLHRADTGLPALVCPVAATPTDCLLSAIASDYGVISDPATSDDAKSLALLYLGHWLGDLHQPLHISYKDDTGGNAIATTGACGPSNLHSIWDTCIIVQRIYANKRGLKMSDDPRFIAKAKELAEGISAADKSSWLTGETWQWANESYAITRSASAQYCVQRASTCDYSPTARLYRKKDLRTVVIDQEYLNRFSPTIAKRLAMGGARLAWLLNRAFDPTNS